MILRRGAWAVAVTAGLALVVLSARAQNEARGRTKPGREVTLTGRVVDLHCFMTGQMPSSDPVRCTADCIRAGVPAGLETDEGLILLGQGAQGPAKTVAAFAFAEVEVHGKLFENGGVRYLDIASIDHVQGQEEAEDEGGHDEDDE